MKQKIKQLVRTEAFLILLIVLVWHGALLVFGVITEQIVTPNGGVRPAMTSLTSHTHRWDSGWYSTITREFYNSGPGHEVFYPLFPLLIVLIQKLSLGILSITTAAFILNTLATFVAAVALFNIIRILLKDKASAWLGTILFLAFPTAFFMHAFYTEALFCALGFSAYYFALRRKWLFMGLCLGMLTATRITSLLFIGLCALEYWRAHDWSLHKFRINILYFLLAPLGFISYGLYLLRAKGDFLGMFHAYDAVPDWAYQQFNPNFLHTYLRAAKGAFLVLTHQNPIDNGSFANTVLPTLGLTLLLVVSLIAIIKIRSWAIPLGVFGLVSFAFFTLNNNVVSAHRYVLPALVVYTVFAWLIQKKPAWQPAALVFIGLLAMSQVLLQTLFISGYFVG